MSTSNYEQVLKIVEDAVDAVMAEPDIRVRADYITRLRRDTRTRIMEALRRVSWQIRQDMSRADAAQILDASEATVNRWSLSWAERNGLPLPRDRGTSLDTAIDVSGVVAPREST